MAPRDPQKGEPHRHWPRLRRTGERDHPGWRVSPSADGRGAPPEPRRGPPSAWWLWLFVLLAVANIWIVTTVSSEPQRVEIPYQPTFIAQVEAGNVSGVNFAGDAITGTFTRPIAYPPATTDPHPQLSPPQPPPPATAPPPPLRPPPRPSPAPLP